MTEAERYDAAYEAAYEAAGEMGTATDAVIEAAQEAAVGSVDRNVCGETIWDETLVYSDGSRLDMSYHSPGANCCLPGADR